MPMPGIWGEAGVFRHYNRPAGIAGERLKRFPTLHDTSRMSDRLAKQAFALACLVETYFDYLVQF